MNWNEVVRTTLMRIAQLEAQDVESQHLSLLDDLRLSSLQLTQLMTKLDQFAGKRLPTEEWFAAAMTTGEGTIQSLVSWLNENAAL